MKIHHHYSVFSLLILFALSACFLTGCSPSMAVRLSPEYEVSLLFESGTGAELSKTFTAMTGKQTGAIQTGTAVKSLKAAGLTASAISQDGSQFSIATGPDDITTILSGGPATFRIAEKASFDSTTTALSVVLSPETAQYIISLLPEETASYTELFMAPIFTGEIMSSEEYAELIAAVYGQQLADELTASRFTLSISVPGKISSVSIPAALNARASKNGENVLISLPLSSLLTLSDAQSILVFFANSRYTN